MSGLSEHRRNGRLVVLDMAGTTVRDDGVVMHAFHAALADARIATESAAGRQAERIVHETMGQSKIDVFRLVLGDEAAAQRANAVFEQAYADAVRAGSVRPIAGSERVLHELRELGYATCLTTGFAVLTRELLFKELGWEGLVDLALSPADAGRGRPYPDMVWTAMLRLGAGSVDDVAVVGDTASDMQSGRRAGIPRRIGVLTGADGSERLRDGGATAVIGSVAELVENL
jgi:phosphoglycolate phosphatase